MRHRDSPLVTAPEEIPEWDDDQRDACIVCGRSGNVTDFQSCNGCGNALCVYCASEGEDDFGNVRCDPWCGL